MDKGPANNKTYKDQYHFTDDFNIKASDYPSLNGPSKINESIKENPYRSNVNIEGGEIIMQPELDGLFKAKGNKHSKGGMDVFLKDESFVFSDFKDLFITEDEQKLFELKAGGVSKYQNTPAKILQKNVNVKDYNRLVANLGDKNQDDLAKNSSMMMLDKYIQTLGNIAYLQEKKKDFPDGIPFFANGTAPVYDTNTKEQIMESKQYAKYGGNIGNPYMQAGGYLPPYKPPMPSGYGTIKQLQKQMKEFNEMTGKNLPLDYKGLLQARRDVMKNYPEFVQYYYQNQKIPINNSLYGKNPSLKNYTMDELLNTYEDLPKGAENPLYGNELIDYKKVDFNDQAAYNDFIKGKNPIMRGEQIIGYDDPGRKGRFYIPSLLSKSSESPERVNDFLEQDGFHEMDKTPDVINPNAVTGTAQGIKKIGWEFTPWQKISQGYNWGQFANAKRYMPYRSRYNATYAEPSLLNPEQAVGDAKAVTNTQLKALSSLSPILRNAQASSAYGQLLSAIPGIRSQYDNQNSQINNQFRQYNNQIRNNESMVNMQNDQNYYQQAITARANFDNMRSYLSNQAMNNVMRDVETNQKLAYNMATMDDPAYGFDWKSGNFYRNPKNILDSKSVSPQDTFQNMLEEVQKMKQSGLSDQVISALVRGQFFKQAAPYFSQQQLPSYPYKKGGKIKNPYK